MIKTYYDHNDTTESLRLLGRSLLYVELGLPGVRVEPTLALVLLSFTTDSREIEPQFNKIH